MDIKRAVKKRVKIVRQRSGLTQDQFAEQVGLGPKYSSRPNSSACV
jgi:DNA-binding XRE family transcriptional regulator